MSTDLHELFATAGHDAPVTSVDPDAAVHQGRRLRARRRTATGAALLGVGAALTASVVALSGLGAPATGGSAVGAAGGGEASAAPTEEPAASEPSDGPSSGVMDLDPGELTAAERARLMAVSLPDPAPGFPVRRWADPQRITPEATGDGTASWTRVWGLAETPYRQETSADGQVTEFPTGPEITLRVGYFPMPRHGQGQGIYATETFVEDVDVAGGRGWITTTADKGTRVRSLYLDAGDLSVVIVGMGGVSTAQLVALGDSLRGLT
jgi:hypothetical protein